MDPGKRLTHRFFLEGGVRELTEEFASAYASINMTLDMALFPPGSPHEQALRRASARFEVLAQLFRRADPEAFAQARVLQEPPPTEAP